MADMKNARLLKAEEIECRVALVRENGLSLLLYIDARAAQKILDELYTPFGWRRSHQSIDGSLYCTLEVWDGEKKQWVGKQDVGTMSEYEKEKGQASDSFKRACYNWGIGRELYTAPFIWIPAEKAGIQRKENKLVCQERFSVRSISYGQECEVSSLEIMDSKGQTVYFLQKKPDTGQMQAHEAEQEKKRGQEKKNHQEKGQGIGSGLDSASLLRLMVELNRTGVALEAVLGRYGIGSIEQMTPEIYDKAMRALRQSNGRGKAA